MNPHGGPRQSVRDDVHLQAVMMRFELEPYHRGITKQQVVADIAAVARELNRRTLTQDEYRRHGKYSPNVARRRCGSWLKALVEAGLSTRRQNAKASPDEFIPDLKRVAKLLGKSSVTTTEYQEHGRFASSTLANHFGSWFAALDAAGLDRTRTLHVTDEQYFKNLERVWLHLGRQPRHREIQKPLSSYCAGAYERRFGSWRKALQAFVSFIDEDTNGGNEFGEASDLVRKTAASQPERRHKTKRQISERLKVRVLIRDGNKCRLCGVTVTGEDIHFDHIKPWAKGGETTFENIQVLCAKHNLAKGDFYEGQ